MLHQSRICVPMQDSIPAQGTEILHVMGQLSTCAPTTGPAPCNQKATRHNEDPAQLKRKKKKSLRTVSQAVIVVPSTTSPVLYPIPPMCYSTSGSLSAPTYINVNPSQTYALVPPSTQNSLLPEKPLVNYFTIFKSFLKLPLLIKTLLQTNLILYDFPHPWALWYS